MSSRNFTSPGPVDFEALYKETCRLEARLKATPTPTNIENIRKTIANHRRAIEIFRNHLPPSGGSASSGRAAAFAGPSSLAWSHRNTVATGGARPATDAERRDTIESAIAMLTDRVEALEELLWLRDDPDLFKSAWRQISNKKRRGE